MLLSKLYAAAAPNAKYPQASETMDIQALAIDSRYADANTLFVAIKGTRRDGHDYILEVLRQGCRALLVGRVLTQEENDLLQSNAGAALVVEDTARALGLAAAEFYGNPSKKMRIVGVTGTNGKTTTATLLYKLFTELGYQVGLVSTISYRIGLREYDSTHTTPDAIRLQSLFAEMQQEGCEYVFMEVSSHAVHQQRIAGTLFAGAIFTNLSHDHLDYHGSFAEYAKAKKAFFDGLHRSAFALVNIDDRKGEYMLQNCAARQHSYALRTPADFKALIIENHLTGLHLEVDGQELHARLVGDFNAYNFLSVYAAAVLLQPKEDRQTILQVLSRLQPAEGRFERVQIPHKPDVLAIVDYAHTPDALEQVLQTLDRLRAGQGRIITVVGCGGDRDRAKRPLMAKIAATYSQLALLSSDNPRTEKPEAILAEMMAGLPLHVPADRVEAILDRRAAIRRAVEIAQAGDIVLVAGKGHEKYQEINGERFPFDDSYELRYSEAASA